MLLSGFDESGADDDLGSGGFEGFQNARNVGRVVLAVAIYPNDEIEIHFEREFVTRLNATAETEMHRETEHVGACLRRHSGCSVDRVIVDHKYRHVRKSGLCSQNNPRNGVLLIQRGNDDQDPALHPA